MDKKYKCVCGTYNTLGSRCHFCGLPSPSPIGMVVSPQNDNYENPTKGIQCKMCGTVIPETKKTPKFCFECGAMLKEEDKI